MCICMTPVASGTNALNLLYPRFMRSLIPFPDIAFICLPYHHYFSSYWCSHEISVPFWQDDPSPPCFHTHRSHHSSLGHLWSVQESLHLSSDHLLSGTEHIGLLILPGAILEGKKWTRYGNDSQSKWEREGAYITGLSIHFPSFSCNLPLSSSTAHRTYAGVQFMGIWLCLWPVSQ